MTKGPTVYDVAERSRVSTATVSRVLRSPGTVRAETRERVLEAVRDLGYVPSAAARGLASQRTNVIGLVFPGRDDVAESWDVSPPAVGDVAITADDDERMAEPDDLHVEQVLRGAELEAWRRGFVLMVAAGRGGSPAALLDDIGGRVDGLAVLAHTVADDLLSRIARRIPVVVLAGPDRADGFDHVTVSGGAGMRTVAEHVLRTRGARDVVYVAGPPDSPAEAERLDGFRAALAAVGIAERDVPVLRSDSTWERGRAVAERILAGSTPRAIVCSTDQTALAVLDVLEARGIRVPDEVLVTGFDGSDAGRHSHPSLTTVYQPMVELGRAAVLTIAARLDDPELPPQSLTLPVRVVLRDSCP